jgi:hypothetical protein
VVGLKLLIGCDDGLPSPGSYLNLLIGVYKLNQPHPFPLYNPWGWDPAHVAHLGCAGWLETFHNPPKEIFQTSIDNNLSNHYIVVLTTHIITFHNLSNPLQHHLITH